MSARFLFAWYDLWIGAYWDRAGRRLYILPVPCFGIVITFEAPMSASLPLDRVHRVLDPRIRRFEADARRRRPSAREVLDELQAVRRELVGAPLRRYDRQLELELELREREKAFTRELIRRWNAGAPARDTSGCSGVAAKWCPIHGTCQCIPANEDHDRDESPCPLHSAESDHAAAALEALEEGKP